MRLDHYTYFAPAHQKADNAYEVHAGADNATQMGGMARVIFNYRTIDFVGRRCLPSAI